MINNRNNKKQWIAIYTRPKWEKKVNLLTQQQGIASFCPLVKTRKRWADRYKTVELPLFNSYVFAEADPHEQHKIQQISGVVNIVYHCGKPATLTYQEIERIKTILEQNHTEIESVSLTQLDIGDKIKVKNGILTDWQGEVISIKGKSVVMILDQFNCALIAKVDIGQQDLI